MTAAPAWGQGGEIDYWAACDALGFLALGAEEGHSEVEPFDLVGPAVCFGSVAA